MTALCLYSIFRKSPENVHQFATTEVRQHAALIRRAAPPSLPHRLMSWRLIRHHFQSVLFYIVTDNYKYTTPTDETGTVAWDRYRDYLAWQLTLRNSSFKWLPISGVTNLMKNTWQTYRDIKSFRVEYCEITRQQRNKSIATDILFLSSISRFSKERERKVCFAGRSFISTEKMVLLNYLQI